MHVILLALGIVFEVAATVCLKLSDQFTRGVPTALMVVGYLTAFALFGVALRGIELSVAYAIWSGLGTTLVALIGIAWFREPATTIKLVSIGLIITGVAGLNLAGGRASVQQPPPAIEIGDEP
jgi:small multidrug resistance pump